MQTILKRASERARKVSESIRPQRQSLRTPAVGAVDRIDPRRLRRLKAAPQDVEREDAFERGLAAVIGLTLD